MSFSCSSSFRARTSRRTISRLRSLNGLPDRDVSIMSRVRMSNSRLNFSPSSSCHCSTRLPGATTRHRSKIAARDQLLHEKPGHDRLASARIVGEQEAQRLARQHLAIDGRNLVRQRIDEAGVNREIRIEIMRELDAVGLGHEPQQRAIGVERPRPPARSSQSRCSSSR